MAETAAANSDTDVLFTIKKPHWLKSGAPSVLQAIEVRVLYLAFGALMAILISAGTIPKPLPFPIPIPWVNPHPTPDPTPKPTPLPPAPIPEKGLRVLILYESSELSKYPPAQMAVLFDPTIRTYLDSATPVGTDNKTHEYRIWDKDVSAAGDSKLWQAALARPHASMPWIVVSNGTTGFEGPLPGNAADTLALIKKYETH